MKIVLSPKIKSYWIDSKNRFSMQSLSKFIFYFFDDININIKNELYDTLYDTYDTLETADVVGVIYDIQDDYEIPDKKLNIMLCIENCPRFSHYKHYNKFGSYGNTKISIYFYGFLDKIEKSENFIAIPIIYTQMNYFQKYYNLIQPSVYTKYEDKKFCLIATTLNFEKKYKIYEILNKIDSCEFITSFGDLVGLKSIYQDEALLNLFNQYKFVFVCENCDDYITEKIFNCFFSRTIPIYCGSNKINYYFNESVFINAGGIDDDELENKITSIHSSKNLYDSYFSDDQAILNEEYDDENYKEQLNSFISKRLNKL
jgi:hypothetical protein